MDGKVELSIIQLDKLREELKERTDKVAELEKNAMKVELVVKEVYTSIVEESIYGHYRGLFPKNDVRVISREHINLDRVKEALRMDVGRELQQEMAGLREQIREGEEKIKNTDIKWEKKLDTLKQRQKTIPSKTCGNSSSTNNLKAGGLNLCSREQRS